jgi:hypothetical protein
MTYSQFQFLPLRVMPPPPSSSLIEEPKSSQRERYRLLKFTDARDPRHRHLYPISGTMIENNESQSNPRKKPHKNGSNSGRLLEITDNWCLLPRDMIDNNNQNSSTSTSTAKWREAPYPHRGHPILYVPGHWGSFSQSRSIGAHGTRWTEPYARAKLDQEMYESLQTGRGMNDGLDLPINGSNVFSADHDVTDWLTSSQFQNQRRKYLDGFVMDVFALDFDGEGAALHPSRLVRQADFFARAVQTIAKGCQLLPSDDGAESPLYQGGGVTIVAHSIGAWAVRIAMKRHPTLFSKGYIRNIIALASPLSSIPYKVDDGVHKFVHEINYGSGYAVGDSTMISISGGIRDEMIPPEVCEVSSNPSDTDKHKNLDDTADKGFVSSAILASSIINKNSSDSWTSNDGFGMDHRAIVWCYDLLKEVREVVFSLVVASDKGLTSSKRMDIAMRIMNEEQDGVGVGRTCVEEHCTFYQEKVKNQRLRLLLLKGYWKTVSIQLSALYNLNSLLSMCMYACVLDAYGILPVLDTLPPGMSLGMRSRSIPLNMALRLLALPSLVVMSALILISGPWKFPRKQEGVLLGTTFMLLQVASLVYFFVVHIVMTLPCRIFDNQETHYMKKEIISPKKTFWGIFFHLCAQQLRSLALVFLPLTVFTSCTINAFMLGNDDLAWNRTSLSSFCFMSFLLHNLIYLIISACRPLSLTIERPRGVVILIALLLFTSTWGEVLYKFSLTTQLGQTDSYSYIDFLSIMSGSAGTLDRHIDVWTSILPFFTVAGLRTQDIIVQRSCSPINNNELQPHFHRLINSDKNE